MTEMPTVVTTPADPYDGAEDEDLEIPDETGGEGG
jgi:hypothetical protein